MLQFRQPMAGSFTDGNIKEVHSPFSCCGLMVQDPERIVSQKLPWTSDAACSVLVDHWALFAELAGPRAKRAEPTAKRLKRLLGSRKPASNKEALEAAQLLLELLQAFGPPEPREPNGAGKGAWPPPTALCK